MTINKQTSATTVTAKSGIDWPVIAFFALAYLIAWGLLPVFNTFANSAGVADGITLMGMTEAGELTAVAEQLPVPAWFLYLLTRIQDFAFTIAGLIVTAVVAGRPGFAILGHKLKPRLAGWQWYGAALLLPYGLFGLAAALAFAGDNSVFANVNISLQTLWAVLFGPQAGLIFYMLLRGGLGEEPGLRGFALPRLQMRHGPTVATVVIGILWAGWHLPVYLRSDVGAVIASLILAFSFAFLFTFFYNFARESLWVVIVLHAGMNAGDNAFEVIFPGLAGQDWQIPAYLGLLLASIILGVFTWRRNRQEKLLVTAIG